MFWTTGGGTGWKVMLWQAAMLAVRIPVDCYH